MNFLIHFKIHNKVHNCKKMSLGNKLVLQYNLQIFFFFNCRMEAVALLSEAKGNVLPLFKFIELFDKR